MIDYHLRFASEEEAHEVLFDGDQPKYPNTDVIGVIYKPTGVMLTTDEGEIPETAPVPGWHVNIRGVEDAELAKYHISVATPVRVWA